MQNFIFVLFYFVLFRNFINILSYEDSDCSHLQSPELSPRECCEYPIVYINQSTIQRCFKKCPAIKSEKKYENDTEKEKDACCLVKCFYEKELILLKNGTTDIEMLKASFKTRNGTDLSDKWFDAIDKSVNGCSELYPRLDDIEHCLPVYHRNVLKCSYITLFLNCVNYSKTEGCKALRKNVQECSNSREMTLENWSIFFA